MLAPITFAQNAATMLLDDVTVAVEAITDASLTLTGRLLDGSGGEIALEMDILAIPGAQAVSAYILQPDALADNMIVLDGDTVANYTFLTHQITLFDASDPDALGGLVTTATDGPVDLTLDIQAWFEGWTATLGEPRTTEAGAAQVVQLTNPEAFVNIVRVEVAILEATNLPYELLLFGDDDELVAEIRFENLRIDEGLGRADVVYLPEDAEVIDERASAQAQ